MSNVLAANVTRQLCEKAANASIAGIGPPERPKPYAHGAASTRHSMGTMCTGGKYRRKSWSSAVVAMRNHIQDGGPDVCNDAAVPLLPDADQRRG
jgi:hypothetical protein